MTLRAQIEYWKNRAEVAEAKAATIRSDKWPSVRASHLKKEPWCQYCLGVECLEVHHVSPFHVDPARELDDTNLITLCEQQGKNCHLKWGHLGSWKTFNPNVRSDCRQHNGA